MFVPCVFVTLTAFCVRARPPAFVSLCKTPCQPPAGDAMRWYLFYCAFELRDLFHDDAAMRCGVRRGDTRGDVSAMRWGDAMPGDAMRCALHDQIVEGLHSRNFEAAQTHFNQLHYNVATIIGDPSGTVWEHERGWVRLDDEYEVLSQGKIITALAIH